MRLIITAMLLLPLAGCGVELLTTAAIQGELAAQNAKHATAQLEQAKSMTAEIELSQAIRVYQAEHGKYPPSLEALVPDYLAYIPAGYNYDPATGAYFQGNASGGSDSLSNSIPPADVRAMLQIREAVNAYGGATGFYPPSLDSLVPTYLPAVPMASSGEPYLYNNQDGDLVHPSRIGQPTVDYGGGSGAGGYSSGLDSDDSYAGSNSSIDARQRRNAAQYGGVAPTSSGYTGSVPNPKATIDRTKSNLNKALQGRGQ